MSESSTSVRLGEYERLPVEISHYIQMVRRRWWLAALPALAALLVAGFLAYAAPKPTALPCAWP